MTKIEPMLAAPMKKAAITNWSDWSVEEKFDGHRLIVTVTPIDVTARARPRDDGRMIERVLPPHLYEQLLWLPPGVYDGELMGGVDDATGTDASRKDLAHKRSFTIFDMIETSGSSMVDLTYNDRRTVLEKIFTKVDINPSIVRLAVRQLIKTEADVRRFVKSVWATGGEGAILKLNAGKYYPGKRAGEKKVPVVWIKIKRVSHAVLTLVGFEPSRGTVRFPGHPFAICKLMDADGNETTCKTRDDDTMEEIIRAWHKRFPNSLIQAGMETSSHPWIKRRRVVIEFPKRTRDGGYQGPVIFDRWAEEGE